MWELKVVRERRGGYGSSRRALTSPEEVFTVFRERFEKLDREEFVVVPLDTKSRPLGFHVVSVGSLGASLVHPREAFKVAILANAASVILVHNHPSGDPEPSPEDQRVTERLKRAGEIIGIPVLDHLVIGDGRYISFVSTGRF